MAKHRIKFKPFPTPPVPPDKIAFAYLDELRKSGKTNMFGAGRYLEEKYHIPSTTANHILKRWMENFQPEREQ